MGTMNGGARWAHCPMGDGSLVREKKGNLQLAQVARMIKSLLSRGAYFPLENPSSSFLFKTEVICEILKSESCFLVTFDQCMYGLVPPDRIPGVDRRVEKSTTILTNIPQLKQLQRSCDGQHVHVQAIGHVKLASGSVSRARVAGAYPLKLCAAWAKGIAQAVDARIAP